MNEVYARLGCTKTDISRWKNNPFSTHATTKLHKTQVVLNAMDLFHLSQGQAESLANKAGLSLFAYSGVQVDPKETLIFLLKNCNNRQRKQIYHLAVSERMIQHYLTGKTPTKQALLAIAILLGLASEETGSLLRYYGYSLSRSLANDAVVHWFMEKDDGIPGAELLYSINETLDLLGLPLLLTKQINRG